MPESKAQRKARLKAEKKAKLEAKRAAAKDERGACWGAATSFLSRPVAGEPPRASHEPWGGARDTAFGFVASSSFKASRDEKNRVPGSVRGRGSPPSPLRRLVIYHGEPPVGAADVRYLLGGAAT